MYNAVDGTQIDMQPKRDENEGVAIYFIVYMLVSAFFFMNMFVGVTYDRFMDMKDQMEKDGSGSSLMLTKEQEEWLYAQRLSIKFAPRKKMLPAEDAGAAARFC